ncbi:unnamed protein product [Discula destructiva]
MAARPRQGSMREAREQRIRRMTRTTLQYSHDYFDYFHRDEPYPGIPARHAAFHTFPIPRWTSSRRPDPSLNPSRPLGPRIRNRTGHEFFYELRTDNGEGCVIEPRVRQRLEAVGIEVGRILGAGSQGLAIAIKDQRKNNLVVKCATDVQTMVVEMWAMKEMAGARHIVQRRWIPGLSDNGVGSLSEDVTNNLIAGDDDHTRELARLLNIDLNNRDQKTFIYAMEYMKYGNMNGLLRKISLGNVRLKSKELWRIFYCLFRACVGLAYDGWDENDDPETQLIPTQEEFAPFDDTDQLLETHEGLVDFDINDRNVMIGVVPLEDMNRGEAVEHSHDDVPVFKIGDLGIVRAFRGHHRDSMLALSSSRVLGNQWANTPEQFTQAWKYYSETDAGTMNADDTVAGKYDWWTNLWQVARLMAIMINQYQPDIPPECMRTTIIKPDGISDVIWTYGSDLLDDSLYGQYDLTLRTTVAWCLAHRPRDRPTMDEMEQALVDGIARKYAAEDQDARWVTIAELLDVPAPARTTTFTFTATDPPDLDM